MRKKNLMIAAASIVIALSVSTFANDQWSTLWGGNGVPQKMINVTENNSTNPYFLVKDGQNLDLCKYENKTCVSHFLNFVDENYSCDMTVGLDNNIYIAVKSIDQSYTHIYKLVNGIPTEIKSIPYLALPGFSQMFVTAIP